MHAEFDLGILQILQECNWIESFYAMFNKGTLCMNIYEMGISGSQYHGFLVFQK